jgi:hypothetical protein
MRVAVRYLLAVGVAAALSRGGFTLFAVFPVAFAGDDLSPPAPRTDGRTAGVSRAVESAVETGLEYLLRHQKTDGSWGASPRRANVYPVTVTVTGLVGLAFLANGNTPTRGEYAHVVERIANFLRSASSEGGSHPGFIETGRENVQGRSSKGPRPMYGPAFSMTSLAEIYGQEGSDPTPFTESGCQVLN